MYNILDGREMGIQGDLLLLENFLFYLFSGCVVILIYSIDILVIVSRFFQKLYSFNWCGIVIGFEWKENCINL